MSAREAVQWEALWRPALAAGEAAREAATERAIELMIEAGFDVDDSDVQAALEIGLLLGGAGRVDRLALRRVLREVIAGAISDVGAELQRAAEVRAGQVDGRAALVRLGDTVDAAVVAVEEVLRG